MKLYDRIVKLLTEYPDLRNSDMRLFWRIWTMQGLVSFGQISEDEFMHDAIYPETIRRCRQLVQANHPELQSESRILKSKKLKESSKGTFAYREEFTGKLF